LKDSERFERDSNPHYLPPGGILPFG